MKLDAIRPAANNAEVEMLASFSSVLYLSHLMFYSFQMDVNKKDDIDNLVKFVEEREKSLDILINNVCILVFSDVSHSLVLTYLSGRRLCIRTTGQYTFFC